MTWKCRWLFYLLIFKKQLSHYSKDIQYNTINLIRNSKAQWNRAAQCESHINQMECVIASQIRVGDFQRKITGQVCWTGFGMCGDSLVCDMASGRFQSNLHSFKQPSQKTKAEAIPGSAASCCTSPSFRSQLCLSAAEAALSLAQCEAKRELAGNRGDCYANICLFVDVV